MPPWLGVGPAPGQSANDEPHLPVEGQVWFELEQYVGQPAVQSIVQQLGLVPPPPAPPPVSPHALAHFDSRHESAPAVAELLASQLVPVEKQLTQA